MWTLFDHTVKAESAVRSERVTKGSFQTKVTDAVSTARDQIFYMLEDVNSLNTSENDTVSRQFTAKFVH